jgi:peptidoglycan hydrolase-like amidase
MVISVYALLSLFAALLLMVGFVTAGHAAATTSAELDRGQRLSSGQALRSPDGRFSVAMQSDGNLVVRSPSDRALWNSGTPRNPGAYLVMQGDGNAVVYSSAGRALWSAHTSGRGGARLVIQSDGNFVLYPSVGAAVWASHTESVPGTPDNPRPIPAPARNVLRPGSWLRAGQQLTSPSGQYRAAMQSDGNLVVYGPTAAVWSTRSAGWNGAAVVLQGDGNFVLYTSAGTALYSTRTNGKGPDWLILQDDGQLVLQRAVGPTLWSSRTAGAITVAAPPSAAITSGAWSVVGHGNGHGRGLSQYGSYGRAQAGQTAAQILSFYYHGAALTAISPAIAQSPVRVLLSRAAAYAAVRATAGMSASGVGVLPTAGIASYRLVSVGAGLTLQKLATGAPATAWTTVRTGLPASVTFSPGSAALQVVESDGTSATYRGTVTGVLAGGAVHTVNTLGLDDYVRGVAPNESPSSWPAAAVQAQVVAARTYARFEVVSVGGTGYYDICDTTSCQVYDGEGSEAVASNAAVDATRGQIVTYAGAPVFAQFSSSNGGWTFDGGQPYLIAQPDPYDNASTDPWFNWSRAVPVGSVAAYYGLSRITALRIVGRNGHGDWGGAVTSAQIDGVRNGLTTTLTVTGSSLRSAMKLPLEWFTILN